MTTVAGFVFNPFQENTYVVYDETNDCVIIDPGCQSTIEQQVLIDFISSENLIPVKLINTHCHIDHILGNHFVYKQFGLLPEMHKEELPVLEAASSYGSQFGMQLEPSPGPVVFHKDGDVIRFGNTELAVLYTPGHSPGEISLFNEKQDFVIAGDVLFQQSIGRTDLPGGDYDTLINSIKTKLLTLDDHVKVYSGHGPESTIGFERTNNPFLQN